MRGEGISCPACTASGVVLGHALVAVSDCTVDETVLVVKGVVTCHAVRAFTLTAEVAVGEQGGARCALAYFVQDSPTRASPADKGGGGVVGTGSAVGLECAAGLASAVGEVVSIDTGRAGNGGIESANCAAAGGKGGIEGGAGVAEQVSGIEVVSRSARGASSRLRCKVDVAGEAIGFDSAAEYAGWWTGGEEVVGSAG